MKNTAQHTIEMYPTNWFSTAHLFSAKLAPPSSRLRSGLQCMLRSRQISFSLFLSARKNFSSFESIASLCVTVLFDGDFAHRLRWPIRSIVRHSFSGHCSTVGNWSQTLQLVSNTRCTNQNQSRICYIYGVRKKMPLCFRLKFVVCDTARLS